MPASFPSISEALKYKVVFKDVVETIEDVSFEELPVVTGYETRKLEMSRDQ